MQKGRIGLVGFGDDVFAFAQTGVGTCGIEFATDNESGVETCRAEDGRRQAGGRGFAVAIWVKKRFRSAANYPFLNSTSATKTPAKTKHKVV